MFVRHEGFVEPLTKESDIQHLEAVEVFGLDIKISPDGKPHLLEVNGMNSGADGYTIAGAILPDFVEASDMLEYDPNALHAVVDPDSQIIAYLGNYGYPALATIANIYDLNFENILGMNSYQLGHDWETRLTPYANDFGIEAHPQAYVVATRLVELEMIIKNKLATQTLLGEVAETDLMIPIHQGINQASFETAQAESPVGLVAIKPLAESQDRGVHIDRDFYNLLEGAMTDGATQYLRKNWSFQRYLYPQHLQSVLEKYPPRIEMHDGESKVVWQRASGLPISDLHKYLNDNFIMQPYIPSLPYQGPDGNLHDGVIRWLTFVEQKSGKVNVKHLGGYVRLHPEPYDLEKGYVTNLARKAIAAKLPSDQVNIVTQVAEDYSKRLMTAFMQAKSNRPSNLQKA